MAKRDPEARRKAIIEAAADLVVEVGPERITHRLVAERAQVPLGSTTQYFTSLDDLRTQALSLLAQEIDDDLGTIRQALIASNGAPDTLVDHMHDYLTNSRKITADVSLMSAGAFDADLRELSLRWQNSLIEILTGYVGADNALALAMLADGVVVYAVLHERAVSKEFLHTLVAPFMAQK